MLKRIISAVLLCGLASASQAIDLSGPRDEAADREEMAMAMLYAPLAERIYDIKALVMLSNTPEELAKYSNDQIKLKKLSFDEARYELVYDFELIVPEDKNSEEVLTNYARRMRMVMNDEDCSVMNFTHAEVANHYIIRNAADGRVLTDFITSLNLCNRTVTVPYAH